MAENNEVTRVAFAEPIEVNVNIPNFEGKAGRDGVDGRDGDDAYRVAVRNGFIGTEQEWLKSLNGDANTVVPATRKVLLENNLWCKDDKVDTVLASVVAYVMENNPKSSFTPLSIPTVVAGQKTVTLTGEPHYKVKIKGYNELHEIGDNGYLALPLPVAMDEYDYQLEYYNFTNVKVGNAVIKGQTDNVAVADDTYEKQGIKYSLFGKTLHANVTGFVGDRTTDPIFLGKWTPQQIEKVIIKVARPTTLNLYSNYTFSIMGNIPIFVDNPQNLTFVNFDNMSTPIQLGSLADGVKPVRFTSSRLQWSDATKAFINTGSSTDHL